VREWLQLTVSICEDTTIQQRQTEVARRFGVRVRPIGRGSPWGKVRESGRVAFKVVDAVATLQHNPAELCAPEARSQTVFARLLRFSSSLCGRRLGVELADLEDGIADTG
jgi:hypothetical protein